MIGTTGVDIGRRDMPKAIPLLGDAVSFPDTTDIFIAWRSHRSNSRWSRKTLLVS